MRGVNERISWLQVIGHDNCPSGSIINDKAFTKVTNGAVSADSIGGSVVEAGRGMLDHWPANRSSAHFNESTGKRMEASHDLVEVRARLHLWLASIPDLRWRWNQVAFVPVVINGTHGSVVEIGPLDFCKMAMLSRFVDSRLSRSLTSKASLLADTAGRGEAYYEITATGFSTYGDGGSTER